MVNNSSGVILLVFKSLNSYIPKSTMGVVDPLKGPSSDSMKWSDNFKLNSNYFNISRPKIISYLPLTESSTWHLHVATFIAISAGKAKSTLTLRWVVISPDCVCHCIVSSFSGYSILTILPNTILELHPLSNRIQSF